MAESLNFSRGETRENIYKEIIPQIESVISTESDLIANLANTSAILKEAFGFFWVGFYLVKEDQLVLGPFQGTLACTRIKKGKGVCGKSWETKAAIIVPDVENFEGHIACSSLSKSEIVVPIIKNGNVVGVLDVDSDKLNDFNETDKMYLEEIVGRIVIRD